MRLTTNPRLLHLYNPTIASYKTDLANPQLHQYLNTHPHAIRAAQTAGASQRTTERPPVNDDQLRR